MYVFDSIPLSNGLLLNKYLHRIKCFSFVASCFQQEAWIKNVRDMRKEIIIVAGNTKDYHSLVYFDSKLFVCGQNTRAFPFSTVDAISRQIAPLAAIPEVVLGCT